MNGYVPHNLLTVAIVSGLLAALLLTGFTVTGLRSLKSARLAAWLLVIVAVASVERLTAWEPAGVRMLAIIVALLWTMKTVVSVEDQATGRPRLGALSWFLFATGWPGMGTSAFAAVPGPPRHGWAILIKQGLRNLLAGAALIGIAWLIGTSTSWDTASPGRLLLVTIILLPGLSLVLHFGLLNVIAGLWRRLGADCHSLFRIPLKSTSLREFWGRRWNLAFSQMTALAVYRPLKGIIGPAAATMAAFLLSGFLHELAISVPVRAGYGLPKGKRR